MTFEIQVFGHPMVKPHDTKKTDSPLRIKIDDLRFGIGWKEAKLQILTKLEYNLARFTIHFYVH